MLLFWELIFFLNVCDSGNEALILPIFFEVLQLLVELLDEELIVVSAEDLVPDLLLELEDGGDLWLGEDAGEVLGVVEVDSVLFLLKVGVLDNISGRFH